jgi:hypothetical protein
MAAADSDRSDDQRLDQVQGLRVAAPLPEPPPLPAGFPAAHDPNDMAQDTHGEASAASVPPPLPVQRPQPLGSLQPLLIEAPPVAESVLENADGRTPTVTDSLLPPSAAMTDSSFVSSPTPPPVAIAPVPTGDAEGLPQVVVVGEEDGNDGPTAWLLASPPWLVSCAFHALAVIVLGLIPFVIAGTDREIELVLGYTDQVGEQLELEAFTDEQLLKPDDFEQVLAEDLEAADEPLPLPPPIPMSVDDLMAAVKITAPQMGLLLSGRDKGMKEQLLAAYGGSEKTEAAVLAGLGWLLRRQDSDGMWSLTGRYRRDARSRAASYSGGGQEENKCAATAMAMLAFQGYGQTHQGGPHEEFREAVERALRALLRQQHADGSFTRHVRRDDDVLGDHQLMYTQALFAFALCELYAMTKDPSLHEPAQRAVDYLVEHQDQRGGWRYRPGSGSDLSVTGWVMMALQSARMGGLTVPRETLYAIERFLDETGREEGSRYAYMPRRRWSLAMTAEGLLCRQYLGWQPDHESLLDGAELLLDNPIDYEEQDVYYWYYATQVLHNMEGRMWKDWNAELSTLLPAQQVKDGDERGSWNASRDAWGTAGGRLYATCLSLYMLEIYYRHLPIYSLNFDLSPGK